MDIDKLYDLLLQMAAVQAVHGQQLNVIEAQVKATNGRVTELEADQAERETRELVRQEQHASREKSPLHRLFWLVPAAVLSIAGSVLTKLVTH